MTWDGPTFYRWVRAAAGVEARQQLGTFDAVRAALLGGEAGTEFRAALVTAIAGPEAAAYGRALARLAARDEAAAAAWAGGRGA